MIQAIKQHLSFLIKSNLFQAFKIFKDIKVKSSQLCLNLNYLNVLNKSLINLKQAIKVRASIK